METSIGWLLLLQVALILLNAVFACAEIAVLSVNEVKLNKMCAEGNRKAKRCEASLYTLSVSCCKYSHWAFVRNLGWLRSCSTTSSPSIKAAVSACT